MKRFLLYILLLLPCTLLHAQTVTNVDARQDGQNIVITFNMDKPADVTLYYSTSGRYGSYKLIENRYLTKQRISSTEYCYIWNVIGQCGEFSFNNVVFRVEATKSRATTYKSEEHPCILSLGGFYSLNDDFGAVARFGYKAVYAGFKSNFKTNKEFSNYKANIKTDYFQVGSEVISRWSGVLGINWFWRKNLSLYTGIGYGKRIYTATRVSTGNRCIVEDNSAKGIELETGANAFLTSKFGLSLGYSVLAFKYSEFTGGVIFRW